jgi:hypothetical protein
MAYRYSLRDENDPLLALLQPDGSDNAPSLSMSEESGEGAPDNETSEGSSPRDDVLTSMLLDQGRPRGDAYQPSPAAASQNADRQSLDAAWTQREREALDASKPQQYGVWEGLRDNAAPVLAGALDSIFNKGRGLGNIVQGAAGEVGAQQARRDAMRKQEGDLAIAIRGKKGDELAAQRLQYAYDSLHARESAAGGVGDRFNLNRGDRNDPNSQRNATAEEMAYKTALARKQGGAEGAHEYADVAAQDAALKTGATTNAATDALEANPRAITAEQEIQNQLARDQLATSQGIRAQGVSQSNRDKFNAQYKDVLDVAQKARELKDLFSKIPEGGDLPGLGPIDANTPSWLPQGLGGPSDTDLNVRNLVAQFKNPGVHARSGAAVNPSERPALEAEFGKIGDERGTKTAIDNIYNTMVSKLRGGAAGKENDIRELLQKRGLGDVLDQVDRAQGASSSPPYPMQPGQGGDDNFVVTPGVNKGRRSQVAPAQPGELGAPAAIKVQGDAGGVMRHIRKPDGTVVPTMKSDEELSRLPRGPRGYQVLD